MFVGGKELVLRGAFACFGPEDVGLEICEYDDGDREAVEAILVARVDEGAWADGLMGMTYEEATPPKHAKGDVDDMKAGKYGKAYFGYAFTRGEGTLASDWLALMVDLPKADLEKVASVFEDEKYEAAGGTSVRGGWKERIGEDFF